MSLLSTPQVNYNDFSSLDRLRVDAKKDQQSVLKEVAKQFESVFVQMMLKSMREASVPLQGELFHSSQSKAYQDMYDKQLGLEMSKANGIGLADVIVRQLSKPGEFESSSEVNKASGQLASVTRQSTSLNFKLEKTDVVIEDVNAMDSVSVNKLIRHSNLQVTEQQQSPHWSDAKDFINDNWPYAKMAGEKLGVDPRAILAQSALETGWGKKVHAMSNGENSYSLFGIKAGKNWQGKTVAFDTVEYRAGQFKPEKASFRAYDSIAQSYQDYVAFLQDNPRYQHALAASSVEEFSTALQQAGYATDPAYAQKIQRISNSDLLTNTLSSLKNSTKVPLT